MEQWDLYTEDRTKTGRMHPRGAPIPQTLFHVVVEIWTIIDHARILLTQRHPDKPLGLLWECTGGSILHGESSIEGAIRELEEETGIRAKPDTVRLVMTYWGDETIYDVYVTYQDARCLQDVKLQHEEVVDMKLVAFDEFVRLLQQGSVVGKLSYFCELVRQNKVRLSGLRPAPSRSSSLR